MMLFGVVMGVQNEEGTIILAYWSSTVLLLTSRKLLAHHL
jgi:hypothetical protein